MAIHSQTDAPDMDPQHLPAEPELQRSPVNMNGPFGAVTAQEQAGQDIVSDADRLDDQQQQTLAIDDRLQTLYDTYHTSYTLESSKDSAHMQHAKDLAFALLQRHFPASKQYRVEAATLGPLCKYGINFFLKEPDESDSDIDEPPSKNQQNRKKEGKKRRSAHTLGQSELAFYNIEPENMAAFVVEKGVMWTEDGAETLTWRPHTYLVILDDLTTFPRWSRDNVNHRGDVLSDLSGVIGGMQRGQGILFFGPRLELYSYDANDANKPVKPCATPNWRMDMRTTSLAEVDEVLRSFVGQQPVYKDEH